MHAGELTHDLAPPPRSGGVVGGDSIRTVEVLPPSATGETRVVLRAAAAIVLGALFVIGVRVGDDNPGAGPRASDLAPFQILFRDAAPAVQRTVREMQEGLIEAGNVRAATKRWPEVATLAAQGVPPFAGATAAYRWRLVQSGVFVNYVGTPVSPSGAPAFLVLIQEPEPGAVEVIPPGTPPDQVHQRLNDGTLLHVTLWFRADGAGQADDAPIRQPFSTGWTQVVTGTPGL